MNTVVFLPALRSLDMDALSELCEAIKAAAEPRLRSLSRYVTTTVRGHEDWDTVGQIGYVDGELREASRACMRTTDHAEAVRQALRCVEAASSLGYDEADEVRDLVAEAGAKAVA